jgi:hypothetical protein
MAQADPNRPVSTAYSPGNTGAYPVPAQPGQQYYHETPSDGPATGYYPQKPDQPVMQQQAYQQPAYQQPPYQQPQQQYSELPTNAAHPHQVSELQ